MVHKPLNKALFILFLGGKKVAALVSHDKKKPLGSHVLLQVP